VIGWWGGVGGMGGMGGTYQRLSPHTREQVFAIVCGLHNFRCGLIDFFKQFSAFVLALSFDNKTALRAGRKSVAEGSKQWATMDVGGGGGGGSLCLAVKRKRKLTNAPGSTWHAKQQGQAPS